MRLKWSLGLAWGPWAQGRWNLAGHRPAKGWAQHSTAGTFVPGVPGSWAQDAKP